MPLNNQISSVPNEFQGPSFDIAWIGNPSVRIYKPISRVYAAVKQIWEIRFTLPRFNCIWGLMRRMSPLIISVPGILMRRILLRWRWKGFKNLLSILFRARVTMDTRFGHSPCMKMRRDRLWQKLLGLRRIRMTIAFRWLWGLGWFY